MNISAVSHRATPECAYALDEETVVVTLRTGKDIVLAGIVYEDPYVDEISTDRKWHGKRQPMRLAAELRDHLLWSIKIKPPYKRLMYYFEITDGKERMCIYEDHPRPSSENSDNVGARFKFAWLNPSDVVSPPSWLRDTVWYQIMPDRFCRHTGAEENPKFRKWGDLSNYDHHDVYGGDLRGICEKLPYIKKLGINGLYLTPIFLSESNHKYNTDDYEKIDPDFGTEDDLKELVQTAHSMGIKIMLDGVFNHSGLGFFAWQDVLKNKKSSPYYDWFFINDDDFIREDFTTIDKRYYSFSFWSGMPKLNTNNQKTADYLIGLCKHWVRDWDIDGIRFDVGNEVAHSFLKRLYNEVKSIKPDTYLMGEIWTDAVKWINGMEYDSVTNYLLSYTIKNFADTDFNSREFAYDINSCIAMYPEQTVPVLFNFIDNHDNPRAIELCKNESVLLQKLLLLLTMPGSPCIYYGTELPMYGKMTPYTRACMPWNEIENGKYSEFSEKVRAVIELRHRLPQLRGLDVKFIIDDERPRLLHYKRGSIEIYLNAGEEPVKINADKTVLLSEKYEDGSLLADGFAVFGND